MPANRISAAFVLAAALATACGRTEPPRSTARPRLSMPPSNVDEPPEEGAAAPAVVEEPGSPPEPAEGGAPSRSVDADGLMLEDLALGSGRAAAAGDRVVVHYDGRLPDGTEFDSSKKRGQPFELELGKKMLIEGFERAVIGMRRGGIRRATIPPALGYGARTVGGKIPPNATLVFEIELVEIR